MSSVVTVDSIFATTTPGLGGCVIWTRGTGGGGYAWVRLDGRTQPAHRVVYKLLVGPIAPGLQVDHTCHNQDVSCTGGTTCLHRRCVNPHHLEAVTNGENSRRSPHTQQGRNIRAEACVEGHPFDEANTYVRKDGGGRVCRQCRADRMRAYAAEKRATRPTDLPICGHVSRDAKKLCTRLPGHTGKHHAQYEVTR